MRCPWPLVAIVMCMCALAPTRPASAQDPDRTFVAFVEAFEAGRRDEAERRLAELLAAPLEPAQARRYCEEAGYRFWVHVVAHPGERLSRLAVRLHLRAGERQGLARGYVAPKVCGLSTWR